MFKFVTVFLLSIPLSTWAGQELPVKGVACAGEVSALLDSWSSSRTWKLEGTEGDAKVFLSPSKAIGTWLEIQIRKNGQAKAFLKSAEKVTEVSWSETACKRVVSTQQIRYDAKAMAKSFTDESLRSLVSQGDSGIIYAWSPHMPLSMSGMNEMKKAARKLGLKVTVVLDPHANARIAANSALKFGMGEGALKKIESLELFNRKMCMHFPAVLLYSHGKMVGPVYAGFKPEKVYSNFIQRQLTSIQK